MIDDLRIGKAILEEKLEQKMQQAKYYKNKYQEAQSIIKELEKYKYSADELNEIERLNNIIKEVREYIEKEHKLLYIDKSGYTYTKIGKDILKILDKGE